MVPILAGKAALLLAASIAFVAVGACDQASPEPATVAKTSTSAKPEQKAPAAAPRGNTAGAAQAPPGKKTSGPVRVGPVVLDPLQVNFGIVRPHTTVKTEVKITNATEQALKILASVPSCQCTSVDMTGVVIEPGATATMPMSMKTSSTTGLRAASVKLVFEGYNQPVEVLINSEVAHAVRSTPPFIDIQQSPRDNLGQPVPARPLSGRLHLESLDGSPFSIIAFHGEPPVFVGFDPAKDQPRNAYDILYDFSNVPANNVPAYQIVETDRDDCPSMEIRVRHENTHIRPPFKLDGFCAGFGRMQPGSEGEFEFGIKEFTPNRVASVTSLSPDATVQLIDQTADEKNLSARVRIVPRPGFAGLLYFPMQVEASDGKVATLMVYGSVR